MWVRKECATVSRRDWYQSATCECQDGRPISMRRLRSLRPRLRRLVPRFESIHADIAAELVFASSGMMRPFPCAIFLAYNNCAGLTGLGSSFPAVSPSAFLAACSLRNLRQIDIDVL